jgi:hypothetical protein
LGQAGWFDLQVMHVDLDSEAKVWGKYPNYDDVARFVYGRRMWRSPKMRARLLAHWTDERHPYRERFESHRALIEEILSSKALESVLDATLRERGTSLRCMAREIPPVFGSFFGCEES